MLIAGGDPLAAVSFARIYRIRAKLDETTFFFDSVLPVNGGKTLTELGVTAPESKAAMVRLEWPVFEAALKTACGIAFGALPVLEGGSAEEQAYVRELLQLAVIDDLLGPADGPVEEIVGMSVRDRYLVGKLAPMDTAPDAAETDTFGESGHPDSEERDEEVDTSTHRSLVPSSMGFTFCVDGELENVQLFANWGRYERTQSERENEETGKSPRCWKRIPSGGSAVVSLKKRTIEPIRIDADCPSVVVQGSVSTPLENGDRLVTLFLVNTQTMPEQNQDQAWIFQPELSVRDMEGRAVFRRRPILRADEFDEEREALEMIYRDRVEFAVGHGISVHATVSEEDRERATEVRTAVLPEYEIQVTETPGLEPEDRPAMRRMIADGLLDMERLADLERDELIAGLKVLTDDYAEWIAEDRNAIGSQVVGYDIPATEAMDRCNLILERLREGVDVLAADDRALAAFRFANRAMASQRIHSLYALAKRRGDEVTVEALNVRKNRSWRHFQLAFMLLSIPALADPTHRDRTQPLDAFADLLWFPTGGGKTEAYLGVAAFTMGVRRLQGNMGGLDGGRGLAVIMRYTLRLLTLQQFQRATALICAMEVLRRAEPAVWGDAPFTIGLWVGQRVTPNTTDESHAAIEKERDGRYGTGSTPAQLTSCPWCGSEIAPGRDIRVDRGLDRTFLYCGDKYGRCEFSQAKSNNLGLPVLVVDNEIYRHPPSMLIATVDKFAMMAWRGQVRTLFGKANRECPRHGLLWPEADCNGNHTKKGSLEAVKVKEITPIRPPDLIIQDEFHLISGPLGTMVGLYETAVDELSTWSIGGKTIRPKVIASTATVRKAEEQVNNVFLRKVSVFPPHGLNVEDNFFSVQRSVKDKPGRLYMGICSPGSSRPAVLIRVYVALLTAAQSLFQRFGVAADPYMTVVGYFNSLRELGGMRRLAEDDVQTRAYRVQMSEVKRPGLSQRSVRIVDELTSRVSNKEIPKKLDQLEVKFKPTWEKGETRAIDIVLATNMLSVGVDVNRIGLMVVNGQPKNTAEYIQATSRVGRSFPGLVCTVLTWSRPRDLSHYETFEHYHATFYKHVEAQSVTPFAARALDRGLTGAMVSLLRLENDSMNPNPGAQSLDSSAKAEALRARKVLSERAWKVKDKAARTIADTMTADRIDRWVKEAVQAGRRLGYETARGQGDLAALLKKPGALAWDEFTVPMSMREVEPGVQLIMDASKNSTEPPSWKPKIKKANGGDA
ncbi:helicase domain protein [Desulfarculus baarsii DSM 2075]|uniref:Helicase domain protein n=1 Tax=Desulfarculus baarsii (strain ATCC 33931 / DSM 2075 / LMG 7858 / VKM B-1802 / 2st14) TaxID=644282 RepID=E1QK36_DESB2|nr:helicase domain protein [Desulfarculus baarsii DSM 2075]